MTWEAVCSLLEFHYWARDRLLAAVERLTHDQFQQDLGNSFGSIRDTLAHLVSAESAWCSRWEGDPTASHLAPTEFATVREVRDRWAEEEARIRDFVDRLGPDGVDRLIQYSDFRGAPAESVFWQMLQHVVNHATFHRGQVTTMLRQLGVQMPKNQDLITFYRVSGA